MYNILVYYTFMPHVSRIPLKKKEEEKITQALISVVTHLGNTSQTQELMVSLLSPTERLMLAKRLAIIVMLDSGLPESHIASSLHVTRVTVSKMRYLKEKNPAGFSQAIKILEREKLMKDFKKFLIDLAGYSVRAAGGRVKPTIL